MWRFLLTAPRWAMQLSTGVFFGLTMTLSHLLRGDGGLLGSLIGGSVGGLLFGLIGGSYFHRMNQQLLTATGGRAPNRTSRRAVWRGPAPADPEDRRLAVALLDHQISEYDRQRRWAPPMGIAFIALFTWLALDQTPAWWAAVALFGFFLALQLFGPRRQRHRRRLLMTTDGKPS